MLIESNEHNIYRWAHRYPLYYSILTMLQQNRAEEHTWALSQLDDRHPIAQQGRLLHTARFSSWRTCR